MKRFLWVAVICTVATALHAAAVTGQVQVLTKRGQRPVMAETVIALEPIGRTAKPVPSTFTMTTRGKAFLPHVLTVPAGSTVAFPNEDPIAHNLFSLSPGHTFDLGLYRKGAGKQYRFDMPGVVNVYCNIHPNMSAVVHVMATPYYGFADAAGRFRIDVPPGRYRMTAWNEQGGTASSDIEVAADGRVAGATLLKIDGRNYRATPHLNKHGKPYRAPRDY